MFDSATSIIIYKEKEEYELDKYFYYPVINHYL